MPNAKRQKVVDIKKSTPNMHVVARAIAREARTAVGPPILEAQACGNFHPIRPKLDEISMGKSLSSNPCPMRVKGTSVMPHRREAPMAKAHDRPDNHRLYGIHGAPPTAATLANILLPNHSNQVLTAIKHPIPVECNEGVMLRPGRSVSVQPEQCHPFWAQLL